MDVFNLYNEAKDIKCTIDALQKANAVPELRSRSLSLAITEIETGLLWLEKAIKEIEAKNDNEDEE